MFFYMVIIQQENSKLMNGEVRDIQLWRSLLPLQAINFPMAVRRLLRRQGTINIRRLRKKYVFSHVFVGGLGLLIGL
jgi:hypothetical protein